jgi:uncharacterized small protein (DUF1192 family)
MFRFLIFIIILSGVWCLVIMVDQCGWTRPIWDRLIPEVILPRPLTQAEVWVMELENRMANLQQEIHAIEEQCGLSREMHKKLVWQLKQRVGHTWMGNMESNLSDDPIVKSLESAIDNEDRHNEELTSRILDLKTEQARLKSKRISIMTATDIQVKTGTRNPTDAPGSKNQTLRIPCPNSWIFTKMMEIKTIPGKIRIGKWQNP